MPAHVDDDWFNPETSTFGDRLAGAREQAGLSQEDLARTLGIKKRTLCNWEEDLSEPRANRLSMMAGILNVSVGWLLVGEGQGARAPGPEFTNDSAGTAQSMALLAEMRDMHATLAQTADRLARLETKLRELLRVDAA